MTIVDHGHRVHAFDPKTEAFGARRMSDGESRQLTDYLVEQVLSVASETSVLPPLAKVVEAAKVYSDENYGSVCPTERNKCALEARRYVKEQLGSLVLG